MKKVLVLGSGGMAGHMITTYLEEVREFEVYNLTTGNPLNENTVLLDVMELSSLEYYLDSNKFDVIINCIGILNRFAEENKAKATFLNCFLPHYLEDKYSESPVKIIHLSTDCVFSGKQGSYTENSFKDGDSFYDRTKAVGEIVNTKDLTFRMSIIGPDMLHNGIGLFNWFMNSRGVIKGYINAFWTGVTTLRLAKAIEAAIEADLSGLYHLVPNSKISKYKLLSLFKSVFGRHDIEIEHFEGISLDKSLINTRKDFDFYIPAYTEMIFEMKEWIDNHRDFYPHYQT